MGVLLSIVFSFLPSAYRPKKTSFSDLDFRAGALAGGLIQALGSLGFLIYGYFHFMNEMLGAIAAAAVTKGSELAVNQRVQAAAGLTALLVYLVQPKTILTVYFTIEGMVRWLAALVTDEPLGTMPLHLVAFIHHQLRAAGHEMALGRRVPDVVEWHEGQELELQIKSCRPKLGWNHLMTVVYNGSLFEVAKQEQGEPPHRFVYWLRRKPDHKVVRGLHHYHPEEVLEKKSPFSCVIIVNTHEHG